MRRSRRAERRRTCAAWLFPFATTLLLAACAPHPATRAPGAIPVTATPVPLDPADPATLRAGALVWRGGVVLTSSDRRVGGLSALRWHDGALYAASDEGDFFAFRPREEGDRLVGVEAMRVRRLDGLDGKPLKGKAASDFESLELGVDPDCAAPRCPVTRATLSLETDSSVLTYRVENGLPTGAPTAMTAAADWRARQARTNGGIEAMAGSDTIWLMLSEELRDADGRASGYLLHNGFAGDAAPDRAQVVGVPVADGFKPTDLVLLSEAPTRFLLLERRYTEADGVVAMRLVRFGLSLDGGRVTVGPVETLATLLHPPLAVDNMEGLALRREGGRTFIYMISDDNFSPKQRTILIKWELAG